MLRVKLRELKSFSDAVRTFQVEQAYKHKDDALYQRIANRAVAQRLAMQAVPSEVPRQGK